MKTGTVQAGYGYTEYTGPSKTQAQKSESDGFFSEKLRFCSTAAKSQDLSDTGNGEAAFFDYQEFFQNKINEIYEKIQNGDTEPSYQTGSRSFTEKEWNKFLEKFDSIQDTIRKFMREEHEKRAAEQLKKKQDAAADENSLLLAESTSCTYPSADKPAKDIRYMTWYTQEGIFCRNMEQSGGYEWSVIFDGSKQYDKVMEFISQFPSDWNMRFAAHENFWTDFLKGAVDTEQFMEFMKGTEKGVPDYFVTGEDGSVYFDRDKIQWAKYLNSFGNELYTGEEFQKKWEMEIAENAVKLKKRGSYT